MMILRLLVSPFAAIYWMVTSFRNHLYNIGKKKSFQFETNVISVGNLTVGGTGKTPHVEYLINLLADRFKVVTLSRGYGRKTKGFLVADKNVSAADIGDEPMQIYTKFNQKINVVVDEQRARAIPEILHQFEDTDVILLDDAYQHRSVEPHMNILLCNYQRPFYNDYVMPAGMLRESRKGAQRADVIVVSKCPKELSGQVKSEITDQVKKYAKPDTPVFFSTIRYGEMKSSTGNASLEKGSDIALVTAIANNDLMVEELKKSYHLIKTFTFRDHHRYSQKDIENMSQYKNIITTEKDLVKLKEFKLAESNLFYLPIEIDFLEGKEAFDSLIIDSIK